MTLTRAIAGVALAVVLVTLQPLQRIDGWRAERAATKYYEAWATGDRDAGCGGLSRRQRELLEDVAGGTCESAFTGGHPAGAEAMREAERTTRIADGTARVRIAGVGEFSLVREDHTWKVDGWAR